MDGALELEFLDPGSEAWAVHADVLLGRGDPRGELIAIEQRIEAIANGPERTELEAARDRLYDRHGRAWAGELASAGVRRAVTVEWRYGYCRSVVLEIAEQLRPHDLLRKVLNCEATSFLPTLHLRSHALQGASIAEVVSESLWPVRTLTLELQPSAVDFPTIVESDACRAMMDALPYLRELDIRGRRLLADCSHADLEVIRVSGYDAIVGLGDSSELPSLRCLDLALLAGARDDRPQEDAPAHGWLAALVSGEGMPSLRVLDLSRNGVGDGQQPRRRGGRVPHWLWAPLGESRVLLQLDELRLPPLDATGINAVLAVAAALRRVPRIVMPYAVAREQGIDGERLQAAIPQLERRPV
ncbi:hypothetical protein DB30_05643 [Enhygromyxa salina]|uniref:Uncharacterized protein n=1 Tax=Enhygromyxa salina TaxID=215803 RepID=A0A0C2D0K3_9BACT|nr:hypothetical protein [Enhygromyxa salina]KIG15380.1 hypothetical protein DB30_05643 [Enhygromyxa salina]